MMIGSLEPRDARTFALEVAEAAWLIVKGFGPGTNGTRALRV